MSIKEDIWLTSTEEDVWLTNKKEDIWLKDKLIHMQKGDIWLMDIWLTSKKRDIWHWLHLTHEQKRGHLTNQHRRRRLTHEQKFTDLWSSGRQGDRENLEIWNYERYLKMPITSFQHLQKLCEFWKFGGFGSKTKPALPIWILNQK